MLNLNGLETIHTEVRDFRSPSNSLTPIFRNTTCVLFRFHQRSNNITILAYPRHFSFFSKKFLFWFWLTFNPKTFLYHFWYRDYIKKNGTYKYQNMCCIKCLHSLLFLPVFNKTLFKEKLLKIMRRISMTVIQSSYSINYRFKVAKKSKYVLWNLQLLLPGSNVKKQNSRRLSFHCQIAFLIYQCTCFTDIFQLYTAQKFIMH